MFPFNPDTGPDYTFGQESVRFSGCSTEPRRVLNYSSEMIPRKLKPSSSTMSNISKELRTDNSPTNFTSYFTGNISYFTKDCEVGKRAKQDGTLLTFDLIV